MLHSKQVLPESRQAAEEVIKEVGPRMECQHDSTADQKQNISLLGALNKAFSTLHQQILQAAQ